MCKSLEPFIEDYVAYPKTRTGNMSHVVRINWLDSSSFILSLLLTFFVLFLFFLFQYYYKTSKKYKLPPSPSKLPLIGNIHHITSSPHLSFHFLSQEYGPLMFFYLGRVPTLVVSSAAKAEEILKSHDIVCSSRPTSRVSKRLLYDNKDLVVAPYGEYWRQIRKMCMVQLLSPKRVQAYRFVREEETALMIKVISQKSSSNFSSLVNLSEELSLLLNNIICRVSLGKKYSEEEGGGKGYKDMINELQELLGAIDVGDYQPLLCWLKYINGFHSRIERSFKVTDRFLEQVIEDHVSARNIKKASDPEEDDFVDVLLDIEKQGSIGLPFTRDNIKAIILDMFSAGTDTTYTVIEWTMAELMRHPEAMKIVQEEVRSITRGQSKITEELIQQMHYLKSVIKETFRLHPPIPLLVPRLTTEDITVDGYDIPAKTTILFNAWAIGRDPDSWEEPERFYPERFLNGGSSSEIDFRGFDFELIPFGAGRRGCPGIHLAMATVELALANLLKEFTWEMPSGLKNEDLDMVEGTGLTVHKKSALVHFGYTICKLNAKDRSN